MVVVLSDQMVALGWVLGRAGWWEWDWGTGMMGTHTRGMKYSRHTVFGDLCHEGLVVQWEREEHRVNDRYGLLRVDKTIVVAAFERDGSLRKT